MAAEPKPFSESVSHFAEETCTESSVQAHNYQSLPDDENHRPISQLLTVNSKLAQNSSTISTGGAAINPPGIPEQQNEHRQQQRTALVATPTQHMQDHRQDSLTTMQLQRQYSETPSEEEVRRKPYAHPESQPSSSDESIVPRSASQSSGSSPETDTPRDSDDERSAHNDLPKPLPEVHGVDPVVCDSVSIAINRSDVCAEICGGKSKHSLKIKNTMSLGNLNPQIVTHVIPNHNRKGKEHIETNVYVIIEDSKRPIKNRLQQKLWNKYRTCCMRVSIELKDVHSGLKFTDCQAAEIKPSELHQCFKFPKLVPHQTIIRSKSDSLALKVTVEITGMEVIIVNDEKEYVKVEYKNQQN